VPETMLLDSICSPEDIKGLSYDDTAVLCSQIRERLISVTAKNGGHLSNSIAESHSCETAAYPLKHAL